jgi:hypothetical protein
MQVKKILGLAAVGALLLVAAPAQHAQAATPLNPGIATTTAQGGAGKLTTEVRYHRRHWRHRHWRHRHWHHRHWHHRHHRRW